jgi:hypothetical protein
MSRRRSTGSSTRRCRCAASMRRPARWRRRCSDRRTRSAIRRSAGRRGSCSAARVASPVALRAVGAPWQRRRRPGTLDRREALSRCYRRSRSSRSSRSRRDCRRRRSQRLPRSRRATGPLWAVAVARSLRTSRRCWQRFRPAGTRGRPARRRMWSVAVAVAVRRHLQGPVGRWGAAATRTRSRAAGRSSGRRTPGRTRWATGSPTTRWTSRCRSGRASGRSVAGSVVKVVHHPQDGGAVRGRSGHDSGSGRRHVLHAPVERERTARSAGEARPGDRPVRLSERSGASAHRA